MFSRRIALALAALVLLPGFVCATSKPDATGSGDDRLDDQARGSALPGSGASGSDCGPDGKGDLVLIDARTAGPLPCLLATISREPDGEVLFQGRTNKLGQVVLPKLDGLDKARLGAVAEGFAPSYRDPGPIGGGRIAEIEMVPEDVFWLKVIDGEGNYLQDLVVVFKQGDDIVASAKTNDLANIFFTNRTPFAGQPVTVEAQGYRSATINSQGELGEDGHTLTLHR